MKKVLVLAEKPSVARDIARILNCHQETRSYLEGAQYIVTWALGHLIELKMPEDYDANYKTWRLEDLPIIPSAMQTKPIKQTRGQLQAIRQLSRRSDLSELVIATDAGREGELVARWIIEHIGWRRPIKRLWISSQTDRAIRDGFAHLKDAAAYQALYQSAVCRAEADWLIGLNVSRALTVHYNDSLSAGRVQTPPLAMIVSREKQIADFKPQPYWIIQAISGSKQLTWTDGKQTRIHESAAAKQMTAALQNAQAVVTTVQEQKKSENPPLPLDLTELQRVANRELGFSAKKTLAVLQALYERHKIVTYPRTDSRYLTRDIEATMAERLKAVEPLFGSVTRKLVHQGSHVQAAYVFNDQKVTDHHALIPTEEPPVLARLSADEAALYERIVRHFLALFFGPCLSVTRHIHFKAAGLTLTLTETTVLDPGFRAVLSDQPIVRAQPTPFTRGAILPLDKIDCQEKMTEPPALLTEADLLAKMDHFGLGTPATRAEIIERLIHSELMERTAAHKLRATEKGRQLISLVQPELKSPELTARWETSLERIARGNESPTRFIEQIKQQTSALVDDIRQSEADYKLPNLTQIQCPECGSRMKEVRDRQGARILVCVNRSCGYRKRRDARLVNKRCPTCHKKMEIHKGKSGSYFQCRTCGIVEKAEKAAKRVTKHEAHHLMKKINQEEPFQTSMAELLKKALDTKKN
ncbi:MAG: DNA topoisomerase 3 [Sporolactobacillus sp.]